MRPRHVALALALAATAALTSCGTSSPPTPTAATTATSHTPNLADVAYLAAVRPTVQGSTDADLIALGHQACTQLNDDTVLNTIEAFTSKGFTTTAALAITGTAVHTYCTDLEAKYNQVG